MMGSSSGSNYLTRRWHLMRRWESLSVGALPDPAPAGQVAGVLLQGHLPRPASAAGQLARCRWGQQPHSQAESSWRMPPGREMRPSAWTAWVLAAAVQPQLHPRPLCPQMGTGLGRVTAQPRRAWATCCDLEPR